MERLKKIVLTKSKALILFSGVIIVSISGCTHKNVDVYKTTDNRLNCNEILLEMSEIKAIKQEIDDKTGLSGRNIGMGLVFWPGIIVNQMNAGDARKLANSRMDRLVALAEKKNCDISVEKQYSGETEISTVQPDGLSDSLTDGNETITKTNLEIKEN